MTVVVKNTQTGKTLAFCKGADVAILDKITDKNVSDGAFRETQDISRKGYRTLCYAMKELDPKQETFTDEEVEKDLTLIGITGVEDELQEDVVNCIRDFREAGINIWMLTGDKGETAREIGCSCGLFERDNFPIFMVEDGEENLEERLKQIAALVET